MSQSKDFNFESIQDVDSVINNLKTMSDGFKKGELIFKHGKDEIVLKPEGMINLQIKSKYKDGKSKLVIKFKWKKQVEKNRNALIINTCL
ncbi:amphi-Trp domain-containing protein [candidate division WOR-3 bacterium]|nr:amphi-Trp domain-containing protein [candidate division WOR-3 bacterium]